MSVVMETTALSIPSKLLWLWQSMRKLWRMAASLCWSDSRAEPSVLGGGTCHLKARAIVLVCAALLRARVAAVGSARLAVGPATSPINPSSASSSPSSPPQSWSELVLLAASLSGASDPALSDEAPAIAARRAAGSDACKASTARPTSSMSAVGR